MPTNSVTPGSTITAMNITGRPPLLVLIRHGQSTWNESRTVQGQQDDSVLTTAGRGQALRAASELRTYAFDAAISSDLRRTVETASIIGERLNLDVTTTTALRERSYGVYEGKLLASLPPHLAGFANGIVHDADARPEGGESLRDLYIRTAAFIGQLLAERPHRRLLLVTHGGVVRAARAYCAGITMNEVDWDAVDNCSIWPLDLTRWSI